MSYLWKSLSPLVYDGDWHSRLVNAVDLADKEAISIEFQASLKVFRQLLLQNDECLQRVTVRQPLPKGMDYQFACEHVQATCIGKEVTFHHGDPKQIVITVVMRGSLSYVSRQAEAIVEDGLRSANYDLLNTTSLS